MAEEEGEKYQMQKLLRTQKRNGKNAFRENFPLKRPIHRKKTK